MKRDETVRDVEDGDAKLLRIDFRPRSVLLERRDPMSLVPLSVNMKTTLALIISWMVFLIVGAAVALVSGPFDIFIVASLVILLSYGALFWLCRKRKKWGYLGNSVLGVALIAATSATIDKNTTPPLLWVTVLSTVILSLIAVEGFKGYLELMGKL